ncbi:MAG: hypothetical protein KC423_13220 [Anaerolineales bacterium]|nr:hypothetical protein [Anaerolineales bacterium]MCB9432993.1 hypothetical protein [Ardenticatenaceae bacterium]
MQVQTKRMRQLVDWSAAVWGGIIGGTVFAILNWFVSPLVLGGNVWVFVRLFASPLLGEGVLAPPATFDLTAVVAALIVHYALSIAFSLIIAYVIHRGGLIGGILGGGLLGLAFYAINFYTLTLIFPWFFPMRSWLMVATHIMFGAVAGGIYEAMEVEEFVPVVE